MTSSASAIPKRQAIWGRSFAVLAEFPDSDEGARQANAYMAEHPGVGVLDVTGGRVILASSTDKGEPVGPVRRMLCSCCGAEARGRQWHNRDTGYGLCTNCIDFCHRKETPESFRSLYGDRGVHFDVPVATGKTTNQGETPC